VEILEASCKKKVYGVACLKSDQKLRANKGNPNKRAVN